MASASGMVTAVTGSIGDDLPVDGLFDFLEFVLGQRLVVREVEASLLVVDERAFLLDVVAERLPQRVIEQMRRGVVAHRLDAPADRLLQIHRIADGEPPFVQHADMQHGIAEPLRVEHFELAAIGRADRADIADLAALLGVEVRAIEQQGHVFARADASFADDGVVFDPAEDFGIERGEAKLGGVVGFGEFAFDGGNDDFLVALARFFLKLFEEFVVAGAIDLQADLGGHLLDDVDEDTLFRVKIESGLGRDRIRSGRSRFGGSLRKQLDAPIERPQKANLFLINDAAHLLRIALQFREGVAEVGNHRFNEVMQEWLLRPENLPAIALGPAQY